MHFNVADKTVIKSYKKIFNLTFNIKHSDTKFEYLYKISLYILVDQLANLYSVILR